MIDSILTYLAELIEAYLGEAISSLFQG